MSAKGSLSKIALKKYGPRKDERKGGWNSLMEKLKPVISPQAEFWSDENPIYSGVMRKYFPNANHHTVKGGRGAITGQGELKKLVYDPIFSLNHTCAMLRANLNRLFRKTWCTTKTVEGLIDHVSLYVRFHNASLTPSLGDQHS
jgi:hypothetical protein